MSWTLLQPRRVPQAVWMSLVTSLIAVATSAAWGPGPSAFSLSSVSRSCVLGGLFLVIWVLQRFFERQSVVPYVGRPISRATERLKHKDIVAWFHATATDAKDNWVLGWVAVYFAFFILAVTVADLDIRGVALDRVYAGILGVWSVLGVGLPVKFMRER